MNAHKRSVIMYNICSYIENAYKLYVYTYVYIYIYIDTYSNRYELRIYNTLNNICIKIKI